MLIKSLRITNLLSFGPETESLPLAQLNVFIGPNGSGKSNFLEAISLLQAAPRICLRPSRKLVACATGSGKVPGGRYTRVIVENPRGQMSLRHAMRFTEHGSRFELVEERIEYERPFPGKWKTTLFLLPVSEWISGA